MSTDLWAGSWLLVKGRILILDDDTMVRSLLCTCLRTAGYECCETGIDQEALDILAIQHIDVVIQDMRRVSASDGCEFTRLVKSDPRFHRIPVIIFSGYPRAQAEDLFQQAGIDFAQTVAGYFTKPSDLPGLLASLEQFFSGTEGLGN